MSDLSNLTDSQLTTLGLAIGRGFAEGSGCSTHFDGSGGLLNMVQKEVIQLRYYIEGTLDKQGVTKS